MSYKQARIIDEISTVLDDLPLLVEKSLNILYPKWHMSALKQRSFIVFIMSVTIVSGSIISSIMVNKNKGGMGFLCYLLPFSEISISSTLSPSVYMSRLSVWLSTLNLSNSIISFEMTLITLLLSSIESKREWTLIDLLCLVIVLYI